MGQSQQEVTRGSEGRWKTVTCKRHILRESARPVSFCLSSSEFEYTKAFAEVVSQRRFINAMFGC